MLLDGSILVVGHYTDLYLAFGFFWTSDREDVACRFYITTLITITVNLMFWAGPGLY